MHNIVFFDEFHEIDLKPSSALKRYLEMTEKSIPDFFPGKSLHECQCPACGIHETSSQFTKFGFRYLECISCSTLYSPGCVTMIFFGFVTLHCLINSSVNVLDELLIFE